MSGSGDKRQGHSHSGGNDRRRKSAGGPEDGAFDWFNVFDWFIWAAVGVVVFMALEFFIGKIVREKIAGGASKYLKDREAAQTSE